MSIKQHIKNPICVIYNDSYTKKSGKRLSEYLGAYATTPKQFKESDIKDDVRYIVRYGATGSIGNTDKFIKVFNK